MRVININTCMCSLLLLMIYYGRLLIFLGMPLTHRGDGTKAAEGKDVDRRMATLNSLNEDGMKTFLEQMEKEELEVDEEEAERS